MVVKGRWPVADLVAPGLEEVAGAAGEDGGAGWGRGGRSRGRGAGRQRRPGGSRAAAGGEGEQWLPWLSVEKKNGKGRVGLALSGEKGEEKKGGLGKKSCWVV